MAHTNTLSSRQQGPVSNQDRAWICSVLRANDLRHMSSPCGFKTKHCQKRSALAGQGAPHSAVLCMQQAIQSSESKRKPIIIRSTLFCSSRLPTAADTVCVAPIWAAAADVPARLKRGPRHPGDCVHFHYPVWEKLHGRPWMGESVQCELKTKAFHLFNSFHRSKK